MLINSVKSVSLYSFGFRCKLNYIWYILIKLALDKQIASATSAAFPCIGEKERRERGHEGSVLALLPSDAELQRLSVGLSGGLEVPASSLLLCAASGLSLCALYCPTFCRAGGRSCLGEVLGDH